MSIEASFECSISRDGLSYVDDAEFYTPVNPVPKKTLVWLLIRHAALFLQHLDINCVELLLWSQVEELYRIRYKPLRVQSKI